MKKIIFTLAFLATAVTLSAQQPWIMGLSDAGSEEVALIGTKEAHSFKFYTNSVKRMTIGVDGKLQVDNLAGTCNRFLQADLNGNLIPTTGFGATAGGNILLSPGLKFGVGVSPVVALDINGGGKFSGYVNTKTGLLLSSSDNAAGSYGLKIRPATEIRPVTLAFEVIPFDPGYEPVFPSNVLGMPCTAFPVGDNSIKQSNTFLAAATFPHLVQVFNAAGVTLNMGVNNGHGVVSVENPGARLRLNPGCNNDVLICEGGGFTKIFNSAAVVGDLGVSNTVRVGTGTFNQDAQLEMNYNATSGTDAILVSNNALSQSNNKIFEVTGTGQTLIGHNLNLGYNMLTVGQSDKSKAALCLTDNTTTTNKDFFKVYGNGYTEINVYSPTAMPNERALTIRDMSNMSSIKDLFVVKSNGKVYAREVEISLAATFPDYVFSKDYQLKPIAEVAVFIDSHKHLPGFEKGEYYEKNGINVNDMFVKQQEKIEELTLYIIELEKRLQAVEKSK